MEKHSARNESKQVGIKEKFPQWLITKLDDKNVNIMRELEKPFVFQQYFNGNGRCLVPCRSTTPSCRKSSYNIKAADSCLKKAKPFAKEKNAYPEEFVFKPKHGSLMQWLFIRDVLKAFIKQYLSLLIDHYCY